MADESSRLLVNSADYLKCSLAKNSDKYTPGSEYCAGVPDTISDGDNRGRDPLNGSGSIGTTKDIEMRNCSLAKNSDRYTPGSEYCAGVPDTVSDGDNRGREPQNAGGTVGTAKDIQMRNCLMAKNSDGYTYGNQYCAGVPDTVADGDDKGREPQNGQEAGTCIDMNSRTCLLAKNSALYTKGNEYCAGSNRV